MDGYEQLRLLFKVDPIYSRQEANTIIDTLYNARSNFNESIEIYGNIFMKYVAYINRDSDSKYKYMKIFGVEVFIRQLEQLRQLIRKYVGNSKLNTIKIDFKMFLNDIHFLKSCQKEERVITNRHLGNVCEFFFHTDFKFNLAAAPPAKQFLVYYYTFIQTENDQDKVFSLMKYLIKLDIDIELNIKIRNNRLDIWISDFFILEEHLCDY
jgi:hypothetical protein